MLVSLSVLTSAVCNGSLAWSFPLTIEHLILDHPTVGLLAVGDGIASTEGLELGLSILSSSSSQSEEKHQQWVSPLLWQYSQYLPKNCVSYFTASSDSVWGIIVVCVGFVKTCGEYLNLWLVGTSVSEVVSSVCILAALQCVLPFLDVK